MMRPPFLRSLTTRQRVASRWPFMVATGKSKENVGVLLTQDQVRRLSDKEEENYFKRNEAYVASKATETLISRLLHAASRVFGMVVPVDDVDALQKDLQKDDIITKELSSLTATLAL